MIMNVAELKLCEFFWYQIKQSCAGSLDFKRMMCRLKLFDLMSKQIKVFMPSKSMQESVASIIMECLFIDREVQNDYKSQTINVQELIKIAISIFSVATSDQASSFCIFAFLKYLSKPEDDPAKKDENKQNQAEEQRLVD